MSGSHDSEPAVIVARYAGLDVSPDSWRINRFGDLWIATAPAGNLQGSYPSAVEALSASGSCRYEPGSALHIRTGGLISPFELLPALQDWIDHEDAGDSSVDWSEHQELGWIAEVLSRLSFDDLFGLDPNRLIGLDDGLCGVRKTMMPGGRKKDVLCHFVVLRELDPPELEFFDHWAWTSTDNGWGIGSYDIGEIVPGVVGEVFKVDDIGPTLTTAPLPENHPEGLYDEMVAWISGNVSNTSGFDEAELRVEGNTVTAVFPEGWEYGGEASGWLGRTVMRSRKAG